MCFEDEKKRVFDRFLMSQYEFWIHILHIYLRIKTKSVLYTLQRTKIFMQKLKEKIIRELCMYIDIGITHT